MKYKRISEEVIQMDAGNAWVAKNINYYSDCHCKELRVKNKQLKEEALVNAFAATIDNNN